jgi:site-specific DNA-adenine methylase
METFDLTPDDFRQHFKLDGWSDSDIVQELSRVTQMEPMRVAEAIGVKVNEPGFVSSFKRSWGASAQGLGEATGDIIPAMKDNAVQRWGEDVQFRNPQATQSLKDVANDPWLALKEFTGGAAGFLTQQVPLMGLGAVPRAAATASTLAKAATGAARAAGSVPAQVVAAGIPSYADIRASQRETGIDEEWWSKLAAFAGSGAVGAIEIGFGIQPRLAKALAAARTPETRAAALAAIRAEFSKTPLRTAAKEFGKIIGSEAVLEEGTQTPIEQIAGGRNPLEQKQLEETGLGIVGGAMGALPFGLVGGGYRGMQHRAMGPLLQGTGVPTGTETGQGPQPIQGPIDTRTPAGRQQLIDGLTVENGTVVPPVVVPPTVPPPPVNPPTTVVPPAGPPPVVQPPPPAATIDQIWQQIFDYMQQGTFVGPDKPTTSLLERLRPLYEAGMIKSPEDAKQAILQSLTAPTTTTGTVPVTPPPPTGPTTEGRLSYEIPLRSVVDNVLDYLGKKHDSLTQALFSVGQVPPPGVTGIPGLSLSEQRNDVQNAIASTSSMADSIVDNIDAEGNPVPLSGVLARQVARTDLDMQLITARSNTARLKSVSQLPHVAAVFDSGTPVTMPALREALEQDSGLIDPRDFSIERLFKQSAKAAARGMRPGQILTSNLYHATNEVAKLQALGFFISRDLRVDAGVEEFLRKHIVPTLRHLVNKYMPDAKIVIGHNKFANAGGWHVSLGTGASYIQVNVDRARIAEAIYESKMGRLGNARRLFSIAKTWALDTMLHEGLGHALFAQVFEKMPPNVQNAVYQEYYDWLLQARGWTYGRLLKSLGAVRWLNLSDSYKQKKTTGPLYVGGKGPEYWLSFDEWAARRVAGILTQRILSNELKTPANKYWRAVAQTVKKFFLAVRKEFLWTDSPMSMFLERLSVAASKERVQAFYTTHGAQTGVDPSKVGLSPDSAEGQNSLGWVSTEAQGELSSVPVPWRGGKKWLASYVAGLRNTFAPGSRFVDLFSGGGGMSIGVAPENGVAIERNPYVVNLLQQVQQGYEPEYLYPATKEGFEQAKAELNQLIKEGQATGARAASLFYQVGSSAYGGKQKISLGSEVTSSFGRARVTHPDWKDLQGRLAGVQFQAGDALQAPLIPGDFVYADPPYYKTGEKAYGGKPFSWEDQVALALKLAAHDGPVVLSNAFTPEIERLYRSLGFTIHEQSREGVKKALGATHRELIATRNLEPQQERYATDAKSEEAVPTTSRRFETLSRIYGVDMKVSKSGKVMARFNRFMRTILTLPQVERENWNVPGVRQFTDAARAWWGTKGYWIAEWDAWVDKVRRSGYGKEALSKLWRFANEVTVLSDQLGRNLTEAELAREAQKVGGLDAGLMALWKDGRKLLNKALKELEDLAVARLYETWADKIQKIPGFINEVRQMEKALHEDFSKMRNRDYWPLSRFGTYAVHVKIKEAGSFLGHAFKKDATVLFELYETEAEQIARKEELAKAYPDKFDIAAGRVDESLYSFMGLPPAMLKLIEKQLIEAAEQYKTGNVTVDAETEKLVEEQIKALRIAMLHFAPENAFKQRLLRRKLTRGFTDDGLRAMAALGQSFAGHIARAKHRGEMDKALGTLNQHRRQVEFSTDPDMVREGNKLGDLYNYLRRSQRDMLNPGEEYANLRAAGFLWYLGAVPRAVVTQVFQPFFTTGPWLAARYGDSGAAAEMMKGYRRVLRMVQGKQGVYSNHMVTAMDAVKDSINQSLFTELAGLSEGSNLQRLLPGKFLKSQEAASFIRKAGYYASLGFQKGEELNRLVTFQAAYALELRTQLGMKGATDEEVDAKMTEIAGTPEGVEAFNSATIAGRTAVEMTQGEYARWARPELMRGRKSAIFLFKMYTQIMNYFAVRDPGKWRFLAIQMAIAGALGLPLAEDALELLGLVLEKAGWTEGDLRNGVRAYLVELGANPELVMHGLARMATPWDLSASMSLGRVIPGVGPVTEAMMPGGSLQDSALRMQSEALGALFSIPLNWTKAVASGEERDIEAAMPTVVRDIYRTYRRVREGGEQTRGGEMVVPIDWSDPLDIMAHLGQAGGFRPASVAAEAEMRWEQKQAAKYWTARRDTVVQQYYHLYKTGQAVDREALADVRGAIQRYNESVPFPEMRILPKALKHGLEQSMKRTQAVEQGIAPEKKYRRLYSEIAIGFGE